MVQGPPGPPGQDGRDGRDGANAPPVPAPQQIPSTTTNLDTSALEQSFDRVGQNIVSVLTEQRLTNERLEQQFNSNNESLQEQADAMRDLADTTAKRAYDHMFAAILYLMGQNLNSLMIGWNLLKLCVRKRTRYSY